MGLVRLRLLNGSQARIYQLGVEGAEMVKIASDGGYLVSPVALEQLVLAPGDRAEIVVDVAELPVALVDDELGRVLEHDRAAQYQMLGRFPTRSPP